MRSAQHSTGFWKRRRGGKRVHVGVKTLVILCVREKQPPSSRCPKGEEPMPVTARIRNLSFALFVTVLVLAPRLAYAIDFTNCSSVSYWDPWAWPTPGATVSGCGYENTSTALRNALRNACDSFCYSSNGFGGGTFSNFSATEEEPGAWIGGGDCACDQY